MAEFRKSKHGRMFYMAVKADEVTVWTVSLKAYEQYIRKQDGPAGVLSMGSLWDDDLNKDCTEEEFNTAFKEALKVISEQKI